MDTWTRRPDRVVIGIGDCGHGDDEWVRDGRDCDCSVWRKYSLSRWAGLSLSIETVSIRQVCNNCQSV